MRTRLGASSGTLLSLRHFAATQLLAAGVDIRTVAGRLGHSQPSTTLNRYTEWLQARDQDAAETIGSILGSGDSDAPSRSKSGSAKHGNRVQARPRPRRRPACPRRGERRGDPAEERTGGSTAVTGAPGRLVRAQGRAEGCDDRQVWRSDLRAAVRGKLTEAGHRPRCSGLAQPP